MFDVFVILFYFFLNNVKFTFGYRIRFFLGVLYFVDVTTGPESKSGTPSRVFFKLIGENGAHGEVELGEDFSRGRFVQTNSQTHSEFINLKQRNKITIVTVFGYLILRVVIAVISGLKHKRGERVNSVFYYMALACGRYNARSDWLIVTEL